MAGTFKTTADLELGKDSFSPAIDKIINKPRRANIEARLPFGKINTDFSKFEQSIDSATARVVAFTATTSLIYGVGNAFQRLVSDAIKIESVMTRIQSVFGSTAAETKKFQQEIFNLANQTGVSFYQAAEAAEEFSRQGLNLNKTLDATRAALVISKLSGTTAKNAIEGLTATLSTFVDESLDYVEVADKLLALDASFATSAGGLTEGLKRVAGVAAEAGLSLDQTAASLAALKQVTGRSEAVLGNSLKSIFTTIQTEKIQKELASLGVETKNSSGEFRNLIDVLSDLSKVYRDLDDAQRALIAQKIGKTYQANAFQGILKTFETGDYEKALGVSQGASGDAAKRIEMLNKTTEAALQRFSNNITKLGGSLGEELGKPILEKVVGYFDDILSFADKIFGDKNAIGRPIVDGLVSALSGPGLLLVIVGLSKLLIRITKETGQALQAVAGLASKKENIKQIDSYIANNVLPKLKEGELERIKSLSTVEAKQKAILDLMTRQIAVQQRLELAVSADGRKLGIQDLSASQATRYVKRIPKKAGGYLPEEMDAIVAEKMDIMKGVGGARPTAYPILKTLNIGRGPEKVVINSDEKVIRNFAGSGEDAILNRKMMGFAKGKLTKKQLENLEKKSEAEVAALLYSKGNQNAINLGVAKKNKALPSKPGNFQTIAGALSDDAYVKLRDLGRALKQSEKEYPKYSFPSNSPLLSKSPSSIQAAVEADRVAKLQKDLERSFKSKAFNQRISGLEADALAVAAGGGYASSGAAGAGRQAINANNIDSVNRQKQIEAAYRSNLDSLRYRNLPYKEFQSSAAPKSTVTLGTLGKGSALTSIRVGGGVGRFFGSGAGDLIPQKPFPFASQSPSTISKTVAVSAFPRLTREVITSPAFQSAPSTISSGGADVFSNYNGSRLRGSTPGFKRQSQIYYGGTKALGIGVSPVSTSSTGANRNVTSNTASSGESVLSSRKYNRSGYFTNPGLGGASLSVEDFERATTGKGIEVGPLKSIDAALAPRIRKPQSKPYSETGPISSYSSSISAQSEEYIRMSKKRIEDLERKIQSGGSLDRKDRGFLRQNIDSFSSESRNIAREQIDRRRALFNPLNIGLATSFATGAGANLLKDKDGNDTAASKSFQALGDAAGLTATAASFGKIPGIVAGVVTGVAALNKIFGENDTALSKNIKAHSDLAEKYRAEEEQLNKFAESFSVLSSSLSSAAEKRKAKDALSSSLSGLSPELSSRLKEAKTESDVGDILSSAAKQRELKLRESESLALTSEFLKSKERGFFESLGGRDFLKPDESRPIAQSIASSIDISKLDKSVIDKLKAGELDQSILSDSAKTSLSKLGERFTNANAVEYQIIKSLVSQIEGSQKADEIVKAIPSFKFSSNLTAGANQEALARSFERNVRFKGSISAARSNLELSQSSDIAKAGANFQLDNAERLADFRSNIASINQGISEKAQGLLSDKTLSLANSDKLNTAIKNLSENQDLGAFIKTFKEVAGKDAEQLEPILIEQLAESRKLVTEYEVGNEIAKKNFSNLITQIQRSQRSNLFGLGNISGAKGAIKATSIGISARIQQREESKFKKVGYSTASAKEIENETFRVLNSRAVAAQKVIEGIAAERDSGFFGVDPGPGASPELTRSRNKFLDFRRSAAVAAYQDIGFRNSRELASSGSQSYIDRIQELAKQKIGRSAFEGGSVNQIKKSLSTGDYDSALSIIKEVKGSTAGYLGTGADALFSDFEEFVKNIQENESNIRLAAVEKAKELVPDSSISKEMQQSLDTISGNSGVQIGLLSNIKDLIAGNKFAALTEETANKAGLLINERKQMQDRLESLYGERGDGASMRRVELKENINALDAKISDFLIKGGFSVPGGQIKNFLDKEDYQGLNDAIRTQQPKYEPSAAPSAKVDQTVNVALSVAISGAEIFKDPTVQAEMAAMLKPYINQKIIESAVQNGGKKPIELIA